MLAMQEEKPDEETRQANENSPAYVFGLAVSMSQLPVDHRRRGFIEQLEDKETRIMLSNTSEVDLPS